MILTYKPDKKATKTQSTNHKKIPTKPPDSESPPGFLLALKPAAGMLGSILSTSKVPDSHGLRRSAPAEARQLFQEGGSWAGCPPVLPSPSHCPEHTQGDALLPSFPRTVAPTRACSSQGAGSAAPCTAARLMMAHFQGQAPSSAAAAAAKPCHNRTSSTGPCQVLWLPALLQELLFCSASLPTTCCVSQDHSHATGRSGGSLGTFATLLVSSTSGVPCPV